MSRFCRNTGTDGDRLNDANGESPRLAVQMTRRICSVVALAALLCGGLTSLSAAPQLSIVPLGYEIVRIVPVRGDTRAVDVTSRVWLSNSGDPAIGVSGHVTSASPSVIVLDGDVWFGNVPHTRFLQPILSRDTFALRIVLPPRSNPLMWLALVRSIEKSLVWQISCSNCTQNEPPTANAGPDQTVAVGQVVTLDGSASVDPEGQHLSYAWSIVSAPVGSTATVSGSTSVQATFAPDRGGDYVFRLIVNDGTQSSAADTTQVTTIRQCPGCARQLGSNRPPRSAGDAGRQRIDRRRRRCADLSLVDRHRARPEALQPLTIRTPSSRHSDRICRAIIRYSSRSTTERTRARPTRCSCRRPTAARWPTRAPDHTVQLGAVVVLDGAASNDPDGDALSYRWSLVSLPTASTATLQGAKSANPTLVADKPGTYVVQLIVNDGTTDGEPDNGRAVHCE